MLYLHTFASYAKGPRPSYYFIKPLLRSDSSVERLVSYTWLSIHVLFINFHRTPNILRCSTITRPRIHIHLKTIWNAKKKVGIRNTFVEIWVSSVTIDLLFRYRLVILWRLSPAQCWFRGRIGSCITTIVNKLGLAEETMYSQTLPNVCVFGERW